MRDPVSYHLDKDEESLARTIGRCLLVVLATVCLWVIFAGLTGCVQTRSVAQDDQIGQSGQGKDRVEVPLADGRMLIVDLGRDKARVVFRLRRPDGLEIDYLAESVSGLQQASLRAQLEARIASEQNATARDALLRALNLVSPGPSWPTLPGPLAPQGPSIGPRPE